MEIWEVSMTGSNMMFETALSTQFITSICALHDGRRFLVGTVDGAVGMQNLEDLAGNQPVTQDTDVPRIIAFSPSGKMVATKSRRPAYIESRDTTTWESVMLEDIEHRSDIEVAFSADDNQIAVLSHSLVTICDILHPENRLSFNPWPKRRSVRDSKVAFQTCHELVICAKLKGDDSDELSGLLQVWKVKDRSECAFSLDISIGKYSDIYLAPDGSTVIFPDLTLCYSWNHDTAQFHPFHFTDEAYLRGYPLAYSPDRKLFACWSIKDNDVRVWDVRTGRLCGKPITMFWLDAIALSPALNERSLGDRLIALRCRSTNTITLFDVHTGHLYAQCWDLGLDMAFTRDGTKLATWARSHITDPIRIHDLTAKRRNATDGYESVLQDIRDGWMISQDDESPFWVPLEHREVLCLPYVEMIWGRPMTVDLCRFRYGSKWTECIDQGWLKELGEREMELGRLLE